MKDKTIIIDRVEYEIESHDFNKTLAEIKIPKGWRLWKPSECFKLLENEKHCRKLNLFDSWFFVLKSGHLGDVNNVARFSADSGRADLYCGRSPANRVAELGVRFCRDVKK